MRVGAVEAGFPADRAEVVNDPIAAIDRAFAIVEPGDLIVVQVDEVAPMLKRVVEHFERIVGPAVPVALEP